MEKPVSNKCYVVLCVALPLWSGPALSGAPTPDTAGVVRAMDNESRLMGRTPTIIASQAPAPGADAGVGGASPGFDAAKTPDAPGSQKGSVEGTYELMQLIKKAAPQKDKK